LTKLKGTKLWGLQKGNPVEWHNGHIKGTGTVVKPIFETPYDIVNGCPRYGYMPDAYQVLDDATGIVSTFLLKDLAVAEKGYR